MGTTSRTKTTKRFAALQALVAVSICLLWQTCLAAGRATAAGAAHQHQAVPDAQGPPAVSSPAAPHGSSGDVIPAAPPTEIKDEGASLPGTDDPLEGREPYKNWKHHTGEGKDAVVLVRSGSGTVFSGVVLRCDGFLLVPQGVYGLIDSRDTRVEVAVTPTGTEAGDKLDAPLPVAGRLHTVANYRAEYGLIKVNGHHLRSLRALAAWNLKPGTPLRVVYAAPHPSDRSRCVPVTWEATVGAPLPDDRTGQYWSLEGLKPAVAGARAADAAPSSLPAGAAVIDVESGALIGMLTRPGAAPVFSSLLRMGEQVSEVGIAPSRAALKQASNPNSPARIEGTDPGTGRWRQGEMVRVAGGPVLLGGASAAAFRKAYRTDVVCTLDFYIDVYPVSLKEYRAWLLAHPHVTQPRSWGPDERRTPERRQDLPATGMTLVEAAAYATDRDARLVTEVEWLRASRLSAAAVSLLQSETDSLENVRANLTNYKNSADHLGGIANAIAERDGIATARQKTSAAARVRGAVAENMHPEYVDAFVRAYVASLNSIGKYLSQGGGDWVHLLGMINPLDHNDADVSMYGVRHVAMNAPELLVPRGLRGTLTPKVFAAYMDPYISWTGATWDLAMLLIGRPFQVQHDAGAFPTSGKVYKRVIELTPEDGLGWAGLFIEVKREGYGWSGGVVKRNVEFRYHYHSFVLQMGSQPAINPGFRCAR